MKLKCLVTIQHRMAIADKIPHTESTRTHAVMAPWRKEVINHDNCTRFISNFIPNSPNQSHIQQQYSSNPATSEHTSSCLSAHLDRRRKAFPLERGLLEGHGELAAFTRPILYSTPAFPRISILIFFITLRNHTYIAVSSASSMPDTEP